MKSDTSFYGPLMLDIKGTTLNQEESQLLQNKVVGGLILFSRNFQNTDQLQTLIKQIRAVAPDIIIAVDQEGGRVQRFKEGFTRLPCMKVFGELYRLDPDKALHLAKECGWLMASELIAFDIDISFAPVLDIDFSNSEVIGDRAFSTDTDTICLLAESFISGMKEAGMASTGKHYPGHGYVAADSHFDIPVDNRCFSDIKAQDLAIFERLVDRGLDAVMPAHVIYPDVDSQPAGFSSIWLKDILRTQFQFDGVIFSDDLGMEGASVAGTFQERTQAALEAGCDMVLVCNKPDAAKDVLHYLESIKVTNNARIGKMKHQQSHSFTLLELQNSSRWKAANLEISRLIKADDSTQKTVGE